MGVIRELCWPAGDLIGNEQAYEAGVYGLLDLRDSLSKLHLT